MSEPVTPGARVILVTPDNPRLDGRPAVVDRLEDWGAHLHCPAAASGRYRAAWHEMRPQGAAPPPPALGYTGNCCGRCGSVRMRRAGSCEVCEECGSTSGCS